MSRQPNDQPKNIFDDLLAPPSGSNYSSNYSSKKAASRSPAPDSRRSSPVFVILTVLFAAAFLALLVFHFSQRRDYEARIASLKDSFNMARENNEELQEQNTVLQNRYDYLQGSSQAKLDEVEDDLHDMLIEKYLLVTAWYADVLFQRGDYKECASVMRFIYDPGPNYSAIEGCNAILPSTLPDNTFVMFNSNVRLRYIRDELVRLGYLKEGELIISDALGESGIAGENARTDTEIVVNRDGYLTFP